MKRQIEARLEIWERDKKRKPLILRGARQVGKTYILKEFGERFFSKVHYIDFERDTQIASIFNGDLSPAKILEEFSVIRDVDIDIANDILILDEIQKCPRALTALKYFQQDLPNFAVCSAGSLLGVMLGDSAFPVGKVDFLDLYPLNFFEFLNACGYEKLSNFVEQLQPHSTLSAAMHDKIWQLLKHYFVVGGLPEVVQVFAEKQANLSSALRAAREVQGTLLTSYLADIAKYSGKQNSMHIERLWRNIPTQLGKDLDSGGKKFVFKDVIPGLKGYDKLVGAIDWLTRSGLVHQAPIVNKAALPFSAYSKENTFKLYLFDVGMLGALSGLSPASIMAYDYGSFKGYYAENFVLQELVAYGQSKCYCWKEKKSEVEFLLEYDGEITPIEVKSGLSTKTKSLKIFVDKYKPKNALILSGKPMIQYRRIKVLEGKPTSLGMIPLYAVCVLERMARHKASPVGD